jgi:hypothetical protein
MASLVQELAKLANEQDTMGNTRHADLLTNVIQVIVREAKDQDSNEAKLEDLIQPLGLGPDSEDLVQSLADESGEIDPVDALTVVESPKQYREIMNDPELSEKFLSDPDVREEMSQRVQELMAPTGMMTADPPASTEIDELLLSGNTELAPNSLDIDMRELPRPMPVPDREKLEKDNWDFINNHDKDHRFFFYGDKPPLNDIEEAMPHTVRERKPLLMPGDETMPATMRSTMAALDKYLAKMGGILDELESPLGRKFLNKDEEEMPSTRRIEENLEEEEESLEDYLDNLKEWELDQAQADMESRFSPAELNFDEDILSSFEDE